MTALLAETTTTLSEAAGTARADRMALAAERRAAERARELTELLQGRPELRGTYAPADFTVEAVRWCA